MSRIDKVILATCALWATAWAMFVARPSGGVQLISMLLDLPFLAACLAALFLALKNWSARRLAAVVPLLACLLSPVIADAAGSKAHAVFLARSLPTFERVVARIESGEIAVPRSRSRLDLQQNQAGPAYAILAERDSTNGLTAVFLTGGGFPVRHDGCMYCRSSVIAPGSLAADWRHRRAIKPNWYEVSD